MLGVVFYIFIQDIDLEIHFYFSHRRVINLLAEIVHPIIYYITTIYLCGITNLTQTFMGY